MTDPVMQTQSPEAPKSSDSSLLVYTIIAIALAVLVRWFIAAPYLVSGPSMEPTFENNDYLIVDKISYDFEQPQRGDVIVFTFPQNPSETLIKRVIGLPGDTINVSGNTVTVTDTEYPKGLKLSEPYLSPADLGGPTGMTVTLGTGQYFVLGDNRVVSYDSRSWGILPRQDIIGRVFLRLYPFNNIGIDPGEARYISS